MALVDIRFVRNVDGWKRGDRVSVERDEYVNRLIGNGFVVVEMDHALPEPADNASRKQWAAFLTEQGREVHPRATRRDLIDQWRGIQNRG